MISAKIMMIESRDTTQTMIAREVTQTMRMSNTARIPPTPPKMEETHMKAVTVTLTENIMQIMRI